MVYPFRMCKEKRRLPSNPLCSGFSSNKGKISWKVSGMKREKKEGKKDEIFYRALYIPEVLETTVAFCKRANENCVCVPYKTYLLRTGQLNCMRLVLMQLNKR